MIPNATPRIPICPRCHSPKTTKNGTVPGPGGRIQRFRCNGCKFIWKEGVTAFTRRASPKTRQISSVTVAPRSFAASTESQAKGQSRIKPKSPVQGQSSKINKDASIKKNSSRGSVPLESNPPGSALVHHRRLELDIPLDWSASGLLNFTLAAQQDLVQASLPFGQPSQAELQWNDLEPALKTYIRARQHLDMALLLQLNAVFATAESLSSGSPKIGSLTVFQGKTELAPESLEHRFDERGQKSSARGGISKQGARKPTKPIKKSTKSQASQQRGRQIKISTETTAQLKSPVENSSQNSRNTSGSTTQSEEPERIGWLKELAAFQEERRQWTHERKVLEQSVHDLKEGQSQSASRINSVSRELERVKGQGSSESPKAPITFRATEAMQVPSSKTQDLPKLPRSPIPSSSKRVMPPKYSAAEQSNLERMASSLMANLVRLEGHRIPAQDIQHVTGERGNWKATLEHLMSLGKIERQGEYITISLVERLRRGLG
jgi:hypothetical protein